MKVGELIFNSIEFVEQESVTPLITPNHNIGIEVEIENIHYNFEDSYPTKVKNSRFYVDFITSLPELTKWNIVKDNSLRNGCEFIFFKPLKGNDILLALNELDSFFKNYTYKNIPPISSDRCSIHVHLDVRDLNEHQLNTFLLLYILSERVLFSYVHPSRLKNNYCRAVTDSTFKFKLSEIKKDFQNNNLTKVLSNIPNICDKYSALNLLPITSFGSIEFRHHQGTTDILGLVDWINIILKLKLLSFKGLDEVNYLISQNNYSKLYNYLFSNTSLDTKTEISNINYLKKGVIDYLELINFDDLEKGSSTPISVKQFPYNLLGNFINKNFNTKSSSLNKVLNSEEINIQENPNIQTVSNTVSIDDLYGIFNNSSVGSDYLSPVGTE